MRLQLYLCITFALKEKNSFVFHSLSLAVALHGQQDIVLRMGGMYHTEFFLINLKKQTMQLEFCSKLAS